MQPRWLEEAWSHGSSPLYLPPVWSAHPPAVSSSGSGTHLLVFGSQQFPEASLPLPWHPLNATFPPATGMFLQATKNLVTFFLIILSWSYIFRIMGKFPLSMYNCFWDYMICPCPPLGQLHFSALVSLSSLHWPPAQCSTGSWLLFLLWFFTCFSLTWNSPSPGGFLFFHAQFKFYLHRLNFMSCLPAPFHLCP